MSSDQKQNENTQAGETKPAKSEERRRILEDYADGLRQMIEKLRRRFH